MSYAELHCVSNFTFLRGASQPQELVQRARAQGYAALALTDECSLAGIVRAHQAAQAAQLPLVIGSEIRFSDGLRLVFLVEDHAGYTALCELITRGRRAGEKGSYCLARADLGPMPGCCVLWLADAQACAAQARFLGERFAGRAWIAVELHRDSGDAEKLANLQALGRRHGLPLVAAGDVHMHARTRRALQDTVTAIRHRLPLDRCGARLFGNGERHLRTLAELRALYPAELLAESLRIAQRCRFSLKELHYEYPHELVPPGASAAAHLRALTEGGLRERWPEGAAPPVRALIEKELALIAELRYEHFFLTVHDIVRFARARGILCQGRGSAANSAVCYALGITEVDPARMSMLFERFISRERDEPPDIDVDFEHQRREEVIQYVYGKYGRARAALAATVICYRPRSALRDAGKALGFSADQIGRLAQSLAWWDAPEVLRERIAEQGLDADAPALRRLVAIVRQLIGSPRHLSQHVGGFVISEQALSRLVPVENAAMPERTIIQWDKDDLEALGLLKVDCLALGMLSALRRTLDLVSAKRGRRLSLQDIPAEDPATYAMIRAARTMGVFQIESRAQMSMLPRLQPRTFYDLVIQVAIVRPGPIQGGMVHPYLKRRSGEEATVYPSAALEKVLGRTLGVPLFQEQVIEIAIVAAGFSPGEADQVRRSMAAWKRNGGLEHLQARLFKGMAERGYSADFAAHIFEMIKGFGSYGFPESHAASFALLAYASSWLKCHEPAAFTAALLNSQPMGFYPPSMLVREAQRQGVPVRGVDVMHSHWDCTLEPASSAHALSSPRPPLAGEGREESAGAGAEAGSAAIRLGLRLVKGLAEDAAQRIVAARAEKSFADVDDLVRRARLDVRARKLLAGAGALATLAGHRHAARWRVAGIEELPGMLRGHSASEPPAPLRAPREGEEILHDYHALGLTLQRHPLALLRPRLAREQVLRARDLDAAASGRQVRVAGLCMFRQRPETAAGVVFVSLEDETGIVNLIVWPKIVESQRRALLGARLMLVSGRLQREQGVTHVIAQQIEDRSAWLGAIPQMSRDFR